jgi:hypothetical protein
MMGKKVLSRVHSSDTIPNLHGTLYKLSITYPTLQQSSYLHQGEQLNNWNQTYLNHVAE